MRTPHRGSRILARWGRLSPSRLGPALTVTPTMTSGTVRTATGRLARCREAIALHHLDAPWRPADIEQRDGRMLRQGNQSAVVEILRYVTEESFDTYVCLVD